VFVSRERGRERENTEKNRKWFEDMGEGGVGGEKESRKQGGTFQEQSKIILIHIKAEREKETA